MGSEMCIRDRYKQDIIVQLPVIRLYSATFKSANRNFATQEFDKNSLLECKASPPLLKMEIEKLITEKASLQAYLLQEFQASRFFAP